MRAHRNYSGVIPKVNATVAVKVAVTPVKAKVVAFSLGKCSQITTENRVNFQSNCRIIGKTCIYSEKLVFSFDVGFEVKQQMSQRRAYSPCLRTRRLISQLAGFTNFPEVHRISIQAKERSA